jgi:RNA polymerase sigma-70 factor (ECF subfamily)
VAHSDADLVRLALNRSGQAAREIVERYQRPVFNLIVRLVHEAAVAEDLAQDTFVKAFAHLAAYDASYKFSNWIFKIAHNTAIDYLRRPRPVASLDEGDQRAITRERLVSSTAGPLEIAERHELARALDQAIEQLRPEYREVVVLRYQEEMSCDEIAEALAVPVGTVKSYLHRARHELAAAMTAAGWGDARDAAERDQKPAAVKGKSEVDAQEPIADR